ncbi:hypothetical protein IMG5_116260 [Ichthyophthirius multifiliis]|uniref:Transmembrane protein n=1 Tax=Ichthyophthirius multifiliis TaxID=5932 RepID=G0QUC7_ICHMU|nr:hypothetical protein IMG5_116260 [Ichthyophthirius multifiliis]EGR31199.1 hypothetical protein IMG5_116260 [Ichthyophthirius multifiliis]|eukprot:XP_004034685.1 hypothetical protein IMG5_116260 [Ichthyophthirius multifiliis]
MSQGISNKVILVIRMKILYVFKVLQLSPLLLILYLSSFLKELFLIRVKVFSYYWGYYYCLGFGLLYHLDYCRLSQVSCYFLNHLGIRKNLFIDLLLKKRIQVNKQKS